MNIFDRIKQDHDEAREVIEKLKATAPSAEKTRRQLFDWLKLEMWAHHKVEEAVFYSFLRDTTDMHGEAMEAYNEHHMANGVFEKLDTFPVDSEEWGMKFEALAELVTHHMDEEEDDFFPMAKKVISAAEARLMGEQFDARKRTALAALDPFDLKAEMEKA